MADPLAAASTLPLVLCNLLNREFSGARSPVMGSGGGVSTIRNKIRHHRRGEDDRGARGDGGGGAQVEDEIDG
jgi:hypothetical protein